MSASKTLMIAGGGTGGHIYPAIAIAREWMARDPARKVVFVGTRYGLEKEIVPREGFPLEFVEVRGLKGKSFLETVRNLFRIPMAFPRAWSLISRHDPDALLGVGGYASGPVLLVGALRRRPTIVQEQNAYPGITNRILAKVVTRLAVAFPRALEIFGREGTVTGNPVRTEFFEQARTIDPGDVRPTLLVFGGSQGSHILNESMIGALPSLASLSGKVSIVHQTGKADHERVSRAYEESAFPASGVTPYIDDMAARMVSADLVLCRAGAITISELAAVGRASILVPFAHASDNHQEFNARQVESAGGAVVITEAELSSERLAATIQELIGDPRRLKLMGESSRKLATENSASAIVDLIEGTIPGD